MPKTLLLADDSVTIQKVVGISFANEDIVLLTVDNGDDALLRATEARPDIVLADVVMPGRNGYEVCEAIKADPALAGIPVLLLTGTFEAFDEARAQAAGADGHITKPFEAQALVDQVNSLLAEAGPGVPAMPATEDVGASAKPVSPSADTAYDFFDDEVTEPGRDGESPADTTLLGAPTPGFGARSDEAFGFEGSGGDLDGSGGASPPAARPPEEVSAARLFDDPDPSEPLADLSPASYPDTPSMPADGETRLLGGDEALANSAEAGIDPLGSDPASERQTYGTPVGAFDLAAPSDSVAPFDAPASDDSLGEPLEARTVVTALDADDFGTPSGPIESPGFSRDGDPFAAPTDLAPSDSFSEPAEPTTSDPFAAPSDSFSAPAEPATSDPFAAPSDLAPSDSFSAPAEPATSDPFAAPSDLAPSDSFSAPAEPIPSLASHAPAPVLEADDVLEPAVTPFDRYDSAADFAEAVPTLETDRQEDIGDPLDGPFPLDSDSGAAPFGAQPDFEAADPLAAAAGEPPARSEWDGALDDTGDGTVAFEFGGPLADVEATGAADEAILDPTSGRDYDVSSSDLGAPLAAAPSFQTGSAEPDRDESHDLAPPVAGPEISPLVRQEVRDAIEKIAWEAFGQVTETLVKEALERVERIAWEVVPQMTEALIREEIRKLKGSDETGD